MSETRKIFQSEDGRLWMELFPHELEQFKNMPDKVCWFGEVPCSEIQIVKKNKVTDRAVCDGAER